MEEHGDGGKELTPFWLQSNNNLRRTDQLRRRVSTVFFSSGLVVFLLLVTAVLFIVFIVPSTLSLSSQIFKPNSVKKSWDSLNVLLVLVAVVFGFLSRNTNEDRYSTSYHGVNQESVSTRQNETQKSNPWYNFNTTEGEKSNHSSSDRWYDYSDFQSKEGYKNPMLRRNSSSYPDLREFSSTHLVHEDFQRRFDDDMNVGADRVLYPGQLHRRHRSLEEVDYLRVSPQNNTVLVDTLVNKSMQAEEFPHSPPSQPKQPSLPPCQPKQPSLLRTELQERSNRTQKERSRRKVEKDVELLYTVSTEKTPPPPPAAAPPPPQRSSSKSDKKRGGSGGSSSVTKDFLNSLYHKKKKKQRQKSVDNLDLLLHHTQAPLSFHLPPSSPPYPPVLQNLFSSKKHKRKRTITVTVKPSSPATPPPSAPSPPEPPTKENAEPEQNPDSFRKLAEISSSGGESPLSRVPHPPPPPPPFFKKPAWKFVVQGDYVRIDSTHSSRSGSPDMDELDSDTASDTGNATASPQPPPIFCASPDVNTKAESFITNFRAKLKLKRHHSMKRSRELGLSSLGPSRI